MQLSFSKALYISLGLHTFILFVLLVGDLMSPTKPTPTATAVPVQPIKAVVIEKKTVEKQLQKIRDEKSAVKRAQQAAADRARKVREKKAADKAKAKKARERKAAEAKRKKKAAADKKRKEAEAKKKKKALEEKRKKAAADKKRKEKIARDKAAQEKLLADQLAKEMASRQQARQKQVMSELGRYTALITHIIQSNLLTDQATMEGRSCKLTISLSASGYVINVVSGAGDRVVCDAARNAVNKAGKLPVSKDPEVFEKMRTISLTVVPEF